MNKHPAFFQSAPPGKLRCTLCPRFCELNDGQRGFCFVRQRQGDAIKLTTYGRSSGFVIDPIEKKPLYHFYPGSAVLSFGTAGCNLGCRFCQNWDLSKSRELDRMQSRAQPEDIADAAVGEGCTSVAFTYNDPIIFYEYAVDTAMACHNRGVKTVAVTAGYITEEARPGFFRVMDAANIDLKAFSEDFYKRLCQASLQPVLDTLEYVVKETDTWLEITTLLIPGENDSEDELAAMSSWIANTLGNDTPIHFSAFHPDFKLKDRPRTSHHSLLKARSIARSKGLQHVYVGNIHDPENSSSYCSSCGERIISRSGYMIDAWNLGSGANCPTCGERLPGHFEKSAGDWGNRYKCISLL